jgi:magnesium-dependent phosphatase-1
VKKIVFLDGDGTLWYPRLTKRKRPPHWIYSDPVTSKDPNNHLTLTPSTLRVLKRLKGSGVKLAVLSIIPHPRKEAMEILRRRVDHFHLAKYFDELYPVAEHPDSKGKLIEKVLKKERISKKDAIMVGDSYTYDYKSAVKRGIPAVLIHWESYGAPKAARVRRRIKHLYEAMKYIM